ncbi:glycosyl transferase family 9 [Candidatus Moduliflexus flocculans]|uniref:lipopolysaccharide heptosyltransferase II n=1 Tax=Candidatus Moduliflexus flocculans TaxID=1499966 RepID=A0A081BLS7_9BACT|nr:glycosyl transferase family 9 [Candidatus Moduliflexus flocculans]
MSLLFFEALSRLLPQSRIDVIAKRSIQDVFLHHPAIHALIPFSKTDTRGLWQLFQFGRNLRKQERYDAFVTLAPSFSSAMIGLGSGAPARLGYAGEGRSLLFTQALPRETGIHRVVSYIRLAERLVNAKLSPQALVNIVENGWFCFSQAEQQQIMLPAEHDVRAIVFNVNSEASSRRLPLETWIQLGKRLLQASTPRYRLVFIGAPSERERVQQVIQGIGAAADIFDYCGKTSLRELAMLLRDADLAISNDSGPMHLANAVGTPVITFFGAGNPAETAPFYQQNAVVLNKHLECSPCVKNVCKFSSVRCLEQISADEIYQTVIEILEPRNTRNTRKL